MQLSAQWPFVSSNGCEEPTVTGRVQLVSPQVTVSVPVTSLPVWTAVKVPSSSIVPSASETDQVKLVSAE